MSKRLLLYFLLFSILLTACSKEDQVPEKYIIGFSQCTMGDEFRKTMIEEMMREISLFNETRMELVVKDAKDSNEQQIEDINELLAMGIDLLIVSPNESEPLTSIVEKVFDSGIPVINIDRKINSEKFSAFIGADNFMIGQEAGKVAAHLLNNSGKILEITGLEGSSAAIERSGGFRDILDAFPDIEIAKSIEGEWLYEVASVLSDSLFNQFRDVDLVFAHNDPMAYGAYLSAEKHKMHPFILGVDGLYGEDGGIQKVLSGKFTCTFLYPTGGDKAIQLANNILNHKAYKKYNYLSTLVIDPSMARTMKVQGDRINEQQVKIDHQLDYIGEIGVLLKQSHNFLWFSISISVLLLLLAGLVFYFLFQKNVLFRALDGKNRMINEQNIQLSNQRDDLVNLLKVAEEANEEKLRFFTNISHEFRTLISLISLPLNRLLEYENSEEVREKLVVMSKNANRLNKLAHEILRFRKIDTNRYKLHFQESDIVEFIDEVTDAFKPKAKEKGVILTADLPSELMVQYDPAAMEKVLFNLISNAIKHTEKGGIVYIKLEHDSNFVKIIIKDTGKGIPKGEIPMIFDRFYKGSYGTGEDENAGMGIGLALCKELLALHGGSIKVKSKEGKGTTFTVVIPQMYPDVELDKKEAAPLLKAQSLSPKYNQDITILIVEDNAELRSVIAELVKQYYNVDVAVDGLDGFNKAIEIIPDLIISDILMPCMDGIQMTTDLKKHSKTYHIPVILLTAIDSQESTIKGFNTGADDYIVKPFNEPLFIKKIQNLLESHSRIKNKYGQGYFFEEELEIEDSGSKEFVNQLIKLIYENASSESYSLNQLASNMNLSRSSLYRRIKEITGMKAVDFMKKIRLQYAARLLINNNYTINEVAWRTGFSDPRYFSKCFHKEYGQVPSKFKESNSIKQSADN